MRGFHFLRKSQRMLFLRHNADPDIPKNTTKRKKFSGSYSDVMNLPSGGTEQLQDPTTGVLVWLMDYDALP